MYIHSWGSRGSIPVSGPEYVRYGGDTTCIEVRNAADDIIIIDAGSGIRNLGNKLLKEGRFDFHLFFTHAHWDHVLGLPFFKPIYNPKTRIELIGCTFSFKDLEQLLSKIMNPPYFPVPYSALTSNLMHSVACDVDMHIGSMRINSIPLNHPNGGQGYKFTEDGKTFVFLTDNELDFEHEGGKTYEDYLEFSRGADLLVHDAEYTQEEYDSLTRGWGHTVYTRALQLAMEAGVKRFGIFHNNQERTDDAIDELVANCKAIVSQKGVELEVFAVAQDQDISF